MATEPNRLVGNTYCTGNFSALTMTIPPGALTNPGVAPGAAIDPLKMGHQHRPFFSQPNTAATSETRAAWTCRGATGSVIDFRAGSIAIATAPATVTFDLKKNGTTILTGVLTLNSASVARVAQGATLSGSPALAAGDELEVVVTATAGGGTLPTGIFWQITIHEDPQ